MKHLLLITVLMISFLGLHAENWTMLITCKGKTIEATMYDNATTRDLKSRLPLTLDMLDLYGREMTYRFPEALETDDVRECGFDKGEIVYYPPMHSFVIMYAKDDEEFEMQKLGFISNTSDVDMMNGIGDTEMTFKIKEEQKMQAKIMIGSATFTAEIEDSETGRAFLDRLPLELPMEELNGNEKYHYLQESLPTDAKYYGTLEAGDLMLYGNSCIVLFYGNAGGYSYTRIGRLVSTEGLSDAVGGGDITIRFENNATSVDKLKSEVSLSGKGCYDLHGKRLNEIPKGIFIDGGVKKAKN